MSLTSYRAAPPRVRGNSIWGDRRWKLRSVRVPSPKSPFLEEEGFSVLRRPGDDLLSHVLRQSTIGAKAFDGRVRDGIGSYHLARATRPANNGFGRRRT